MPRRGVRARRAGRRSSSRPSARSPGSGPAPAPDRCRRPDLGLTLRARRASSSISSTRARRRCALRVQAASRPLRIRIAATSWALSNSVSSGCCSASPMMPAGTVPITNSQPRRASVSSGARPAVRDRAHQPRDDPDPVVPEDRQEHERRREVRRDEERHELVVVLGQVPAEQRRDDRRRGQDSTRETARSRPGQCPPRSTRKYGHPASPGMSQSRRRAYPTGAIVVLSCFAPRAVSPVGRQTRTAAPRTSPRHRHRAAGARDAPSPSASATRRYECTRSWWLCTIAMSISSSAPVWRTSSASSSRTSSAVPTTWPRR